MGVMTHFRIESLPIKKFDVSYSVATPTIKYTKPHFDM